MSFLLIAANQLGTFEVMLLFKSLMEKKDSTLHCSLPFLLQTPSHRSKTNFLLVFVMKSDSPWRLTYFTFLIFLGRALWLWWIKNDRLDAWNLKELWVLWLPLESTWCSVHLYLRVVANAVCSCWVKNSDSEEFGYKQEDGLFCIFSLKKYFRISFP